MTDSHGLRLDLIGRMLTWHSATLVVLDIRRMGSSISSVLPGLSSTHWSNGIPAPNGTNTSASMQHGLPSRKMVLGTSFVYVEMAGGQSLRCWIHGRAVLPWPPTDLVISYLVKNFG